MEIERAIVLGILQGLSEFIPVSSSGHLVALPYVLGWKEHPLRFDVALHMGTLLPLLLYSWRDWAGIALALCRGSGGSEHRERRRLALAIAAACAPAAVLAALLQSGAPAFLRSPLVVAAMMCIFGLVMLLVDRRCRGGRTLREIGVIDGLCIGAAQGLALIPGVSRSGATLVAGLSRQFSREESARFSFLLATPIILGAELAALGGMRMADPGGVAVAWPAFAAGVIASAVVGMGAITFVLRYLRRHDLRLFVFYRWAIACLVVGRSLVLS